jgi:Na+-transporting NADH:ubiquinone oxidoreductase subunit NqrA
MIYRQILDMSITLPCTIMYKYLIINNISYGMELGLLSINIHEHDTALSSFISLMDSRCDIPVR